MSKTVKNKVESFLKNMQKKPEQEKIRLVWFLTIFFMVGIFCVWFVSVKNNFYALGNSKINLSGLPEFSQEHSIDLQKNLKNGQDMLNGGAVNTANGDAQKNNADVEKMGDKYIQDKNIFGDDGFSVLKLANTKEDNGVMILQYEHYYKNILVLGSSLSLSVNSDSGQVSELQNTLAKGVNIPVDPSIPMKDASKTAEKEIKDSSYVFDGGKLAIAKYEGKFYLVWDMIFKSEEKGDSREILVGAKHGGVKQHDEIEIFGHVF